VIGMKWWSVIKGKRGKYVSKKVLDLMRGSLEELDGVAVDEVVTTKNQHYQFRATYTGEELPAKMSEVKFIVSTGLPNRKTKMNDARQQMKTNARKALARKNVFIGEW